VYIYNRDYDYKRLEAERDRLAETLVCYVNRPSWKGCEIKTRHDPFES